MHLRVMTYNIRHGLGNDLDDPDRAGECDLARIAAVIRRADPDVVALQEVDRWQERSWHADQPAALGEMLGMEHCFGRNVWYEPGEYGVAILSRFPITSCMNTVLPTTEGWERRGVLESTIHVPGCGYISVLNTHLQVGHPGVEAAATLEREKQARLIAKRVRALAGRVVLMGDFNAEPDDPELEPLALLTDAWRVGGDGGLSCTVPAHPAMQPSLRIDMIYVSEGFRVRSARVITDRTARLASDHLPVVADLSMDCSAVTARLFR